MAKNLQDYLRELEAAGPDRVLRISRPVQSRTHEVAALLEQLEGAGRHAVTLFERAADLRGEPAPFRVVYNLFATRELCALAIGHEPQDAGAGLTAAVAALQGRRRPPLVVERSQAPCKEVVWANAEIDLRRFPVAMYHEQDVGPYLVMTNIMRGLREPYYDITFTKNLIYDARCMSLSAHRHHHLYRILQDYEAEEQPAPVVLVLGHHPAFYLSSLALMPLGNDDYQNVGAFLGEDFRLVPSETWRDDFLVPADAEIVIEGYVRPHERRSQNPFGEISGHYQERMDVPVVEVTAVTHRRNAILQAVFPGHQEHWLLGALPFEAAVLESVRQAVPEVRAVHLPMSGCGRFTCFIQLAGRPDRSQVLRAARAADETLREFLKLVIVVDEEIDVYDERQVYWAMVTQCRWEEDFLSEPKEGFFRKWLGRSLAVVDATRPADPSYPDHNRVPAEALRRVRLADYLP